MKRGFFTIMSAQFFSSLADNALFVVAVELLRSSHAPEWQRTALVPMFALFYVVLAPFVGAFADAKPKGRVMFISNAIKVVGCLMMLFGSHPLLAYTIVGLGAAAALFIVWMLRSHGGQRLFGWALALILGGALAHSLQLASTLWSARRRMVGSWRSRRTLWQRCGPRSWRCDPDRRWTPRGGGGPASCSTTSSPATRWTRSRPRP